ncbi:MULTISPECIES: HK97 gp10 family phage protein [Pseudomonas]|uniref:HK97 gp10 family phage protein n=1 Tax=Pseudomonas TaxID=286 RepID=UPI0018E7E8E7|nr:MULTISPECIES: HK97 gp10 family phage protein [Pseudomonas]MBJ2345577.1 HK97 gp10 family phage protein [Pseudomonas canavaninivorans]MBL3544659.1 HK97 gp10 family phage protein [Pseudomonas sp. HB05]
MNTYAGRQGSFSLQLAEFAKQAQEAVDASLREIIIEIGNSLIRMSPVDTGRFRGNWQMSIDAPPEGTLGALDPTGATATARIAEGSIFFRAGTTAFIVNNLPYAIPLEYGHSDQAPGGMVRITQARFQQIVLEAIRNHKV